MLLQEFIGLRHDHVNDFGIRAAVRIGPVEQIVEFCGGTRALFYGVIDHALTWREVQSSGAWRHRLATLSATR